MNLNCLPVPLSSVVKQICLSDNIFQIVCPLCGDQFDQQAIEAHADTCGEDGAIGGEVNFLFFLTHFKSSI
jgi:hypothetical protein